MSWTRWLPPLIMSTTILNSGHSIAEQTSKEEQSECFLKSSVFNNVVDEEYSAPIRFGFMEANSAKKESVYFGMKDVYKRQVEVWLKQRSFEDLNEMRGLMSQRSVANPEAFERANYIRTVDGAKN